MASILDAGARLNRRMIVFGAVASHFAKPVAHAAVANVATPGFIVQDMAALLLAPSSAVGITANQANSALVLDAWLPETSNVQTVNHVLQD